MPASKSSTNHIHLKTSGDHFFLFKKILWSRFYLATKREEEEMPLSANSLPCSRAQLRGSFL
jgi:hypothetical protein